MLATPRPMSRPEFSFPELTPESTLSDLPLHSHQIEATCLGKEVARIFDENPFLPGVILVEHSQLAGLISRRRFLEEMGRPYGLDLFLNRPLRVLYSFVSAKVLVFPGDASILNAARESLTRSLEYLYEPVVVELAPQVYRLLDANHLLLAQAQVHELTRQLLDEKTQAQMLQAEKMASLGRMIAGVAHEILNPVNFIWGNLTYLSNYTQDLIQLLSVYEAEIPELPAKVLEVKDEIGLDFLLQDLPRIITSMKMGSERLKSIAGGLRSFSHANSEGEQKPVNIHDCIDNTLVILNNRIKNTVEMVKEYGDLPAVKCYPGQVSQVFMNIIGNAIDALMEKLAKQASSYEADAAPSWQPQITIKTQLSDGEEVSQDPDAEWVSIQISDNGSGIPPEIQGRIFEHFFTTKPVGEGTGLGLAISHQIISERHKGKIKLRSQIGVGTEFEILLPIG